MLGEMGVRVAMAVTLYRDSSLPLGRGARLAGTPTAACMQHLSRCGVAIVRRNAALCGKIGCSDRRRAQTARSAKGCAGRRPDRPGHVRRCRCGDELATPRQRCEPAQGHGALAIGAGAVGIQGDDTGMVNLGVLIQQAAKPGASQEDLRRAYLARIVTQANQLPLFAGDSANAQVRLSSVYTALFTQRSEVMARSDTRSTIPARRANAERRGCPLST